MQTNIILIIAFIATHAINNHAYNTDNHAIYNTDNHAIYYTSNNTINNVVSKNNMIYNICNTFFVLILTLILICSQKYKFNPKETIIFTDVNEFEQFIAEKDYMMLVFAGSAYRGYSDKSWKRVEKFILYISKLYGKKIAILNNGDLIDPDKKSIADVSQRLRNLGHVIITVQSDVRKAIPGDRKFPESDVICWVPTIFELDGSISWAGKTKDGRNCGPLEVMTSRLLKYIIACVYIGGGKGAKDEFDVFNNIGKETHVFTTFSKTTEKDPISIKSDVIPSPQHLQCKENKYYFHRENQSLFNCQCMHGL